MNVLCLLNCGLYFISSRALLAKATYDDSVIIHGLCDADEDGLVAREELIKCATATGADSDVFTQLDTDGNGGLETDELGSAHFVGTEDCGEEMIIRSEGRFLLYLGTHRASTDTYCGASNVAKTILEEYEFTCSSPMVMPYIAVIREIVENEQAAHLCNSVDISDLVDVDGVTPASTDTCSTVEFRECLEMYITLVQDPAEDFCQDKLKQIACLEDAVKSCGTEAAGHLLRAMEHLHQAFADINICQNLLYFA